MVIDWQHFTPWASLVGGIILGIASSVFILLNGRILGISGIVGGLLVARKSDRTWRLMFLLGMLCSPFMMHLFSNTNWIIEPKIESSFTVITLAGFLVGFGTRYGSGCTSGHGVCGISRLSMRSIVSTLTFMGFGILTVFITRHFF